MPLRFLPTALCLAVLASTAAAEQACVTCWSAKCGEATRSYYPACAAAPNPKPVRSRHRRHEVRGQLQRGP